MVAIAWAEKLDAEKLIELKVDAFAWDVKTYGYGPTDYNSLEKQLEVMGREDVRYYKIIDGGTIIGGLCVFLHENTHCHLGAAYIASGYQNRGIGSRAMELLFREFPGARRWTLDTPYLSFRNQHFYEKLGFQKVGETPKEADGFYLFLYEKNAENIEESGEGK